jgi:hypothetical protein
MGNICQSISRRDTAERKFNNVGGLLRAYDTPPYAGYDNVDDRPLLFSGTIDRRLVATSRVLTIDGEMPVAYPSAFLADNPMLNDSVDGVDLVGCILR